MKFEITGIFGALRERGDEGKERGERGSGNSKMRESLGNAGFFLQNAVGARRRRRRRGLRVKRWGVASGEVRFVKGVRRIGHKLGDGTAECACYFLWRKRQTPGA